MDIDMKGELGTASHRRFLTPSPSIATTTPQFLTISTPLIVQRLVLQQRVSLAEMATVTRASHATCILALHHMSPTNAEKNAIPFTLIMYCSKEIS